MIAIHPKEIRGSWDRGYVLDVHTISSTMIGYNEFGHPEFDTLRSELGEMVYRLKYKGDKGVIAPIVEAIGEFVKNWGIHPDAVVPVPPSKQRSFQPVLAIAGVRTKLCSDTLPNAATNMWWSIAWTGAAITSETGLRMQRKQVLESRTTGIITG